MYSWPVVLHEAVEGPPEHDGNYNQYGQRFPPVSNSDDGRFIKVRFVTALW